MPTLPKLFRPVTRNTLVFFIWPKGERAGCFISIVFLLACVCVSLFVCVILSLPYGVMAWSLIVIVPAHYYLSFFVKMGVLCLSLFCCALLCVL